MWEPEAYNDEKAYPIFTKGLRHKYFQYTNREIRILLLGSLILGALAFVYIYALPWLILGQLFISQSIAGWLAAIVSTLFLFWTLAIRRVDMDRLISSGFSLALLLGIVYGLYSILIRSLERSSSFTLDIAIESFLLFLLGVVVCSVSLHQIFRRYFSKLLLYSRLDYQELLCELSGRVATSLHLPDLISILTVELPGKLHVNSAALMIIKGKKSRLYPENLRFGSKPWSDSRVLIELSNSRPYLSCQLKEVESELSRELLEISEAGYSLVFGLKTGSHLNGMLFLGRRTDGKNYSNRDIQILKTLANQVGLAVENGLNYESLLNSKEQLEEVFEKLVQAEKMAALGEMTAILAHEIKNPLGIIRSSAQYLVKDEQQRGVQQELLHYIMDEVDNLNLVITNLLELARHKPPRFREVELQKEIQEFVTYWNNSEEHKKGVSLTCDISLPLPVLYADFKQLRQVLINCVANSEEAMGEEGSIVLRVEKLDQERMMITIDDDGPGITEDQLKLVFKKFFTTKQKGVGLGLPVCRQIVRAHNGSIQLKNRVEGGVTARISLPLRPLVAISRRDAVAEGDL